jgi:hypothetical protein
VPIKPETYVASVLVVRGAVDGGVLIDHLLSSISEKEEALQEIYKLARALSRMAAAGDITCKIQKDGSHEWNLTADARNLWCTEVLNMDQPEPH